MWRPGEEAPDDGDGFGGLHPNSQLPISKQQQLLPIAKCRDSFLYAVETFRTVVVVGETGSGKTTQLPQYLHKAGWTAGGRQVVCTQPRRMAATTVAARVAEEMGRDLGGVVGYSVRFEDKTSDETAIKFCTDGLLVRQALRDPLLSHVSVVIVDEAHERSLQTDVLLGLLKKVQRKRPDLRVVVSSATMDAELFRDFFETQKRPKSRRKRRDDAANQNREEKEEGGEGGSSRRPSRWGDAADMASKGGGGGLPPSNNSGGTGGDGGPTATILSVTGRTHPVNIYYSECPVRDFVRAAAECVLAIHRRPLLVSGDGGDVLVFLPGGEEVDACCRLLKESEESQGDDDDDDSGRLSLSVLPLYAALPHRDQMRVFERRRPGCRKVIVATPIAETSITLPGVVFVVDGGFAKLPYFNPATGVEALITCPSSQASAKQRAGRAGRTQPGKCFRLYTEESFLSLEANTPCEMERASLTWPILQLKALGVDDVLHFDFPSPPSAAAMLHGLEILYSLGCVDDGCKLTVLGEALAEFPLEPRLAKVLLSSLSMGCASEVVTIAAMLGVSRDLWLKPRGNRAQLEKLDASVAEFAVSEGDHVTLLNVYRAYEDEALELTEGQDDDDGGDDGRPQWGGGGGKGNAREWCNENMVSERALRRARESRQQLVCYLKRHVRRSAAAATAAAAAASSSSSSSSSAADSFWGSSGSRTTTASATKLPSCGGDVTVIRKCLVTGFFANVARLGTDGLYHTLRGGLTVQLHPSSTLAKFGAPPEFVLFSTFVYIDQAFVRDCSKVDGRWLLELAPHFYTSSDARGRRLVHSTTTSERYAALAPAFVAGQAQSLATQTVSAPSSESGLVGEEPTAAAAAANRLAAKDNQGTLLTSSLLGGPASGSAPRPVFKKPLFRKPPPSSRDKRRKK